MNLPGSRKEKIAQNKITTINMIQEFSAHSPQINPLQSYDFTIKNHIFKDV